MDWDKASEVMGELADDLAAEAARLAPRPGGRYRDSFDVSMITGGGKYTAMVNLTPAEYRAWEQRTGRLDPERMARIAEVAARAERTEHARYEYEARYRLEAAELAVAELADPADRTGRNAELDRLARKLDHKPKPKPKIKVIDRRASAQPPVQRDDDRGPLPLRLRLWWMRRRLAWMALRLPYPPREERTYRRRSLLLNGAYSALAFALPLKMASAMLLGLPFSLSGLFTAGLVIWAPVWGLWLVPVRFWRPDPLPDDPTT